MADKKISELPQRTTFDENCSVPVDDGTQSYRVKAEQLRPGLRVRKVVRSLISGSGNFTVPNHVSSLNLIVVDNKLPAIAAVAGGFGLDVGGRVWGWGDNENGVIGDNSITARNSPVQLIGGIPFSAIYGGRTNSANTSVAMFLRSDGAVFCTGRNFLGELGDGTIVDKSSPVQVIGGHSFIKCYAGVGAGIKAALKADGSVWTWGSNFFGAIGDLTGDNRSSPVQVVGGHSFIDIAIGAALKENGEVWTWGWNGAGQLGTGNQGNASSQSSPVQVIGGHSFIQICSTPSDRSKFALKANGEIWSWGDNTLGILGDGTETHRSSPVQVIGGHSFIRVSAGGHVAALKADGSVWTWGSGFNGELGEGLVVTRSSPVQVIGGHSFIDVKAGTVMTLALKANREMWSWGYGGLVGDGTSTYRSSPVQVAGGHAIVAPNVGQRVYTFPVSPGDVIAYTPTGFGAVSFSKFAEVYVQYMGIDS